jgi:hypothetical protein
MYIFLTLFTIANGFIINGNGRGNTILYSSAPPIEPPTDSLLVGLGGNDQDIRPLTREQAQLVLEIWTTSPDCPEYRGKHTIRYLFHTRVVFGENPYLSVLNGVRCPFDDSDLSSYKFKEKVTDAITILPISFAALMKNPKFSLSWNLEKIENKYKDMFGDDEEGDYI